MKIQRGFVVPLVLTILAALFLIGAYLYTKPVKQSNPANSTIQAIPATQNPNQVPQTSAPAATESTSSASKQSDAAIPITTCIGIHKPGSYILGRDIVGPDAGPCITMHDTANVELDCAGHSITTNIGLDAIRLNAVTDFTIRSCVLNNKTAEPPKDAFSTALSITDSRRGVITKNTFSASTFAAIYASSDIQVTGNTMQSQFLVSSSKRVSVQNNTFVFVPAGSQTGAGTQLNLAGGSGNTVSGNTFDGGSDGILKPAIDSNIGADDSITMSDETGDTFRDNDIQNIYDCGIENSSSIFDFTIVGNHIKNAGVAGICGWYYSSVKGNTFDRNAVDDSPELFHFFRAYGVKYASDPIVYFKDNIFSNNVLIHQRNANSPGSHMASFIVIDVPGDNSGVRPVTKADIVTGNNTFTNNNFGSALAPQFYPKDMIIDGGGNICTQPPDTDYPLRCSP